MDLFRKLAVLGAACVLVMSMGCASVEQTSDFSGLKLSPGNSNVCHVTGSASGLYLLWIPLITGDTENPDSLIPAFIKDTVSLDAVANMVSTRAKSQGATHLVDVVSAGGTMWMGPPLFVLFWRDYAMCGNGVK